jgi:phosphate transport system substrate-binding protein
VEEAMTRKFGWMLAGMAVLVLSLPAQAQLKVDPKLPSYKRTTGVTGRIKGVGSDTMNNEMTLWAEGFLGIYPAVKAEIEGKGSGTAPPALIAGTANFGPMSRLMKNKEIDEFKAKYGYAPTALRTSIDMLAVYVNKDNPIKGLTFAQLDAIFSSTRKRGHKPVRTWGDVGLTGEWANKPISIFGRNAASGTYGFFKKNVLLNGDYKAEVKEQPGSAAVVQGVARDKYAIGYSGIGYKTVDVRAVPLTTEKGMEFVPAEAARAYAGEYPLARFLYLYVNHKPGSDLDPLRKEFVKYIFSKQGQSDAIRAGYLPIGRLIAEKELKSVGIDID